MKTWSIYFVSLACLLGKWNVEGWSSPKLPPNLEKPSIASSRRKFIASSITGAAVLASNALETRAAPAPISNDLVQPNSLNGQVMVITGGTTGRFVFLLLAFAELNVLLTS